MLFHKKISSSRKLFLIYVIFGVISRFLVNTGFSQSSSSSRGTYKDFYEGTSEFSRNVGALFFSTTLMPTAFWYYTKKEILNEGRESARIQEQLIHEIQHHFAHLSGSHGEEVTTAYSPLLRNAINKTRKFLSDNSIDSTTTPITEHDVLVYLYAALTQLDGNPEASM